MSEHWKPKIIFEGDLQKKGKINTSVKTRYFVLCNDNKLRWYKSRKDCQKDIFKCVGFIDLNEIIKIINDRQNDNYNKRKNDTIVNYVFKLITKNRIYIVCSLFNCFCNLFTHFVVCLISVELNYTY